MHEPLCEVLLEKLCSAVQKVQEQYASGQEVIKDGEPVNQLCQSVDEIFTHGLREGILHWASGSETTYWPLVSKITYKEVLQNISRQPFIKTDKERCQVWVRVATQENSLGSYLNIITQDQKLLTDFYQPHAFLFDKEKVDTAKTALLYGLSHLDFNISLDITGRSHRQTTIAVSQSIPENSNFTNGYDLSYYANSSYPSNPAISTHSSSLTKGREGHKKKKKKSTVVVIADSFDDNVGRMTSVEQYLYTFSPQERAKVDYVNNGQYDTLGSNKQEEDIVHNVEGDQIDALGFRNKDKVSREDVFEKSNFVQQDKEVGIHNFNDLTSSRDKYLQTESLDAENLETEAGRLRITSAQCRDEISEQNERGHNNQSDMDDNFESKSRESVPTEKDKTDMFQHQNEEQHSPLEMSSSDKQSDEETESQQQDQRLENDVITIDDELEYKVSCARFEFGTPKEVSPCDALSDRSLTELSPEETEDLNFIPGIHKTDPWGSQSGSFSSITGSDSFNGQTKHDSEKPKRSSTGSFSVQTKLHSEKPKRSSTMDSKSSVSSSLPNESWRYVTSLLSSKERKDSKADDMSVATEDSFGDIGMFEELLGMNEDHFSTPESFMGLSSSEELHHAIISCKEMIKSTQSPEEKKKFVKRIIQLRIKLQETKDELPIEKTPDAKKILGHQFVKEHDTHTLSSILCDRCGKWIWTIWQTLFTCQECRFHSHRKCLDMIRRHCASRKVSVSSYSLNITPEGGLNAQQYKCVECRKMISLTKSRHGEARLCDYTGQYFCEDCHWNDHVVIPARIVHNWDYSSYKVSRQTKQFLDLMAKKPILDVEQINPALFKFVGELREIKRLREEILIMKKYFLSCRSALESKLLLQLQDKQHFVDNSNYYSLQDLLEVERGTMLPFITRVHSLFLTHIKSDCQLCRAKGFVCEICRANEVIFAFDPHSVQCAKCRTVFHRLCFKKDVCPKCTRIQKRTPK